MTIGLNFSRFPRREWSIVPVFCGPQPYPDRAAARFDELVQDRVDPERVTDYRELQDLLARRLDLCQVNGRQKKVVGLRKGSEVYLESIDLIARFAQVRSKGSNTTVWIPSDFVD
jgi:hypothetical protein